MSFLNSVLSSIETGKISDQPAPPSSRASAPSASHPRPEAIKSEEPRINPSQSSYRGTAGRKRKAEVELHRPGNPYGRELDRSATSKGAPISTLAARSRQSKTPVSQASRVKLSNTNGTSTAPRKPATPPAATPSKPPLKGSYADLMLQAKQAQQKAPTQVGMIKHQSAPKEKLSKAERKKQALELKAKEREAKFGRKPGAPNAMSGQKGAVPGLAKKREREESTYKGTARPTAPPAAPAYKGTAGIPSRRHDGSAAASSRDKARSRHAPQSKRDDYLGTDEEDEGEGYYDDDEGGHSDESSDMEAGIMDVEEEEQGALQLAKREDEMELKAEMAAKKAKLERKQKLAQLAASRR